MRRGAANILLFSAAVAGAAALFAVLTGGVTFPLLTLRDAQRPALAAIVLVVAWYLTAPSIDRRQAVTAYLGAPGRRMRRVALAASACLLAFAVAHTSRAAGGSDSSCYVLQAEAFARGHATLDNPVARVLPGVANAVFAPTGFLPSATTYGAAVPICAPGLALAMAPAYLIHPSAVFLVVPVAAALLVWLTFLYGRRLDDEVTGACAAILVACSPIVLYQAVQPMSDVPAAAAWMAALVAMSPIWAGLWASVAILIRPNLALLVVALAVFRAVDARGAGTRAGVRRSVVFVAALLPALAVLLVLNATRYGGPFASGYGETDALFSLAHVPANAARYARWVVDTHTPLVLLAALAPFALRHDPARARLAWASLLFAALLVATYLAYTVFDDWWYIRFLLPAVPMGVALSVASVRRGTMAAASRLSRAAAPGGATVLVGVSLIVGVLVAAREVRVARERQAMQLQALESRFAIAGAYARRALPPDAVVLAVQQSGSLRFHGRRDTIAWDAVAPDTLELTIATLRRRGRSVYLALEDAEEATFRKRFALEGAGALDWPPFAMVQAPVRVWFYDPAQRRGYLSGGGVRTELVRAGK